jgi:hypothetical protein
LTLELHIGYLVDIGADVAEYFAQAKIYCTHKSTNELKYSHLKAQVISAVEELNAWRFRSETEIAEIPAPYQKIDKPLFPKLLDNITL